MWAWISGVIADFSGAWYDTSVEPRNTWADRAFDLFGRLSSGELIKKEDYAGHRTEAWYPLVKGFQRAGVVDSLKEKAIDPDLSQEERPLVVPTEKHDAMVEWMRHPENMKTFTNGAFMTDEWRETHSIVLEKNPEYLFADRVNFDRLEIASRPEERANWAPINADRIDLDNRGTVPANVAASFPDSIEQKLTRADGVKAMRLNLNPD